jgi:hypothetical protein
MRDAACASLVGCERGCTEGDATCLLECELARPSAVQAARSFGSCLRSLCTTACVGPKWSCLEGPPPSPPPPTGPAIELTYGFVDYETQAPIPGLVVKACAKTDFLSCSSPLAMGMTDAGGRVKLAPGGNYFDGFAQIDGPDYGTFLFYLPPLAKSYAALGRPLARKTTFQALASAIKPLESDRGHLIVDARDCSGSAAGGVRFDIDPRETSTPFYFTGRIASSKATQTDDDGYAAGGFLNVKPDTGVFVRASVVENGLSFPPTEPVHVRISTTGATLVEIFSRPP